MDKFNWNKEEISNCKKELFNKIKSNPSNENIINYVKYFFLYYVGYQGYYEFYEGEESVYKIHYHGKYIDFVLDENDSDLLNYSFVYKVEGKTYLEAPNDLKNRENIITNLIEEIKIRSYKDIKNKTIEKLKSELKEYYPSNFNIEFKINWIKNTIDPYYRW